MEAAHVNWATLPSDLLSCVGALLSVPGRICFRAVCHAWREARLPEQAGAMPAPWVIMPRVEGCSDSFTVLSAPTRNSFRWMPPGGARARCVGSNGSWLAIVTVVDVRNLAISLVNPLTDASVELPLVTCWRWALDTERDLEFELDVIVRKVAFSPSPSAQDYAAAYVSHCSEAVFCARAGTHGWLLLPELVGGDHEGIRRELDVAYHDGKFYYVGTSGQVWMVDMAAPSPSPVPLDVLEPPFNGMVMCRGYHLALFDGKLHVVWSRSDGDGFPQDYTRPFRDVLLTRYDPEPEAPGEKQWRSVTSIAGRAFLIGDRNQSMSVPVDGNAWLRPNSVYFTNIPLCDRFAIGRRGRRGLWALDVVTGRITWPRVPSDTAGRRQLESEWNAWPSAPSDMIELQLESELDVDWAKSLWYMPSLSSSR
ncbi:unnamed protein product [Alopecurus aequalis]